MSHYIIYRIWSDNFSVNPC